MTGTRRGFLGALAGAASAMVLDPEKLLWRPGARLISIPAVRARPYLAIGDVVTFGGFAERYVVTEEAQSMNDIAEARFKLQSPFYAEQMGYLPVDGLYAMTPIGMLRASRWPDGGLQFGVAAMRPAV